MDEVLIWFYPSDKPHVELPMPPTINRDALFDCYHEYHVLPNKEVARQALRLADIDPNSIENHLNRAGFKLKRFREEAEVKEAWKKKKKAAPKEMNIHNRIYKAKTTIINSIDRCSYSSPLDHVLSTVDGVNVCLPSEPSFLRPVGVQVDESYDSGMQWVLSE
jgi:hypothetical protein